MSTYPPPPSYPPPPPSYQPPPSYPPPPEVPPPAYGGGGFQPAAPPPAQNNWMRWVIGGCGCLVLVAAIFGVLAFMGIKAATGGAEEVVQSFLKATAAERYKEAYGYFSMPLQENQSFTEFRTTAAANLHLFKVTDTTFTERSVDLNQAKLAGTLTLEGGTKMPASFQLVKENEEWRLIAYNISADANN